ncbi:MAG TPA: peptidylprolyl isomerase [Spongiibacteraceae bacterium]|nr:peptidylprolyl isomerase [Spongiibacteraceae bacterium]
MGALLLTLPWFTSVTLAQSPATDAATSAATQNPASDNGTQQQMLDRIVAIVDDDVILASELDSAVTRAGVNMKRAKRDLPPPEQLRRQVFDQLVLDSLQLQIAKRAGVRISDSELNDQLEQIARQNNMTLEQFSQALSKDGIPYNELREQLRREMLIKRVQQGSVSERVQITDQEVENFLNSAEGRQLTAPQYHVLHALLPVNTGDDDEAIHRFADQLTARLRAGADFDQVAATAGPVKVQSSDLGWHSSNDWPTLIVDAVAKLKAGEVADPVRNASGYHIIKLAEARGKGEVIEQTKARHILLKPSAIRSSEQCKQLAAQLRQRVLNGEDFAALARQYSEDIGSAMEGGELGWTNPGQLVAAFQRAMDATKIGAISEPFESRYGWHIVLVEDRRQQDVTDEIRHNIARNYLHEKKYQEELDNWLRKIRDAAFIDIKKV